LVPAGLPIPRWQGAEGHFLPSYQGFQIWVSRSYLHEFFKPFLKIKSGSKVAFYPYEEWSILLQILLLLRVSRVR
jgi:hypothetical protein